MDGGLRWLGLIGALHIGGPCLAQTPSAPHLTVRPHEMATGAQSPQAGIYLLDSFPDRRTFPDTTTPQDYSVYVPKQCAGARRCPLLTILYQGGQWYPIADTYGIILLYLPNTIGNSAPDGSVAQSMDKAMRQVLRKFAVDPDRVALAGTCGSGGQAFFWGRSNLDVFGRVVVLSPTGYLTATTPPQNTTTEFYLASGVLEGEQILAKSLKFAQALRRDGVPRKLVLTLRDHIGTVDDYLYVGQWLHDSWAAPRPATSVLDVRADTLPLLTPQALRAMTAFWTRFMAEPDSIREAGRRSALRELRVPVGEEPMDLLMTDMAALAGRYPAVAADLKAAGLTAQQHDAYRLALIATEATRMAGAAAGTVPAGSVLEKNLAFLATQADELTALEQTNMWRTR